MGRTILVFRIHTLSARKVRTACTIPENLCRLILEIDVDELAVVQAAVVCYGPVAVSGYSLAGCRNRRHLEKVVHPGRR
jgi:hypothetical protein